MKPRRMIVAALLACMFSLAASEALAFYSPQTGHWLNRDRTGEEGGLNLSAFVINNPLTYLDPRGEAGAPSTPSPSGALRIVVVKPAHATGNCGGARYVVQWKVSGAVSGWVVQHFKQKVNVRDCKGRSIILSHNANEEYTEAWKIVNGHGTFEIGTKDTWQTANEEDCNSKGTILDIGKVKFIKDPNYVTVPPWAGPGMPGHAPDAGDLPTYAPTPPGWTDAGAQNHGMFVWFDCCSHAAPIVVGTP